MALAIGAVLGKARAINWGRSSIGHHLVFFLVAFLVLTPLAFLILGSLSADPMPANFSLSEMGLQNYAAVYLDPTTYALFQNTAIYVFGAVILGSALATSLAWLAERTNMPGKGLVYVGVPVTLAMPGMLQAIAWVFILSPRTGFINRMFMGPGDEKGPFSIYSLWGMIFVEGLRLVPTAFLMLVPLMRRMDPALEEAALVSGARPASMLRRVTLPLLLPGLLAIAIYQSMSVLEIFEVPGVLGLPEGIYVFATKIYAIVNTGQLTAEYGQANALAMVYLAIALIATFLYLRTIRRAERYAVVTGKGYRPRQTDLGRWKYAALALAVGYIFLSAVLPFLVLAFESVMPYFQSVSLDALKNSTLENYTLLPTYGNVTKAVINTILMVFATATAVVVLSFLVSLIVTRTNFWGRKILDGLAFMPHAFPGMVIGLALFWLFAQIHWLPFFGTIWGIIVGFTVTFLAYGTRAMNAGLLQIHRDLEEAAQVSGARPWRTMLKIYLPLLLPTFAGVFIWVILLATRIAGMPLMLYMGAENQVMSVLIWTLYVGGELPAVAATGVLMMITLVVITLVVRLGAFRRSML